MISPNPEVRALEPYRTQNRSVYAVARPATPHSEAQQALRLAAMNADAAATTEMSLSLLWRQLARGMHRIVDGFFSEARCYLILALKAGEVATAAELRRAEILEAVLGGVRQKNTAIDRLLAPSTIAMNAKLALSSLGLDYTPSRAHPLLILGARAIDESAVVFAKCSLLAGKDTCEMRVIGLPRPEGRLAAVLPTAELEVIQGLIEGLTHRDIAEKRGTSTRTIANQIGAVFRRLNVSGRNELIQRLVFDPPTPETLRETIVPAPIAEPRLLAPPTGARRSA